MSRLYLIRHGKPASVWGDADDDPGLDDQGVSQARGARDALQALPAEFRPQLVVSSPLRRCRETAHPLAEALGVGVEVDPLVGEIPTPKSVAATDRSAWLRRAFLGTWGEIEGDLDYDAWRREIAAALVNRPNTAVFSHFVAINAVLSCLSGDDRVMSFRPDHASITVLETDGRTLSLVARGREAATGVL
jgi:broad specificity phosphatase PhoE